MRTGVYHKNQEVLAIAVKKVEYRLRFSPDLIKQSVINKNIGKVDDARDFLADDSTDCFVKRRRNETRRRCIVIFLKDINDEDAERFKQGMFWWPTYLLLLSTYQNTYIFSFFQLQKCYRGEYL